MKKHLIIVFVIFIYSTVFSQNTDLNYLFKKDTITIVVTDSGLGGLSVVAGIEKNMSESGHFAQINLIFANALFNEKAGYNSLSSRVEKISTFDKVLNGINQKYKPDLILIACNTLSVLYKETDFAKKSISPILGIIDIGVQEISTAMNNETKSKVFIFGTETTIEENKHKSQLIDLGIEENRIIVQACPQLQQYIENNPKGEDTEMLILSYIDEAVNKTNGLDEDFYVSLNCTHFGYSRAFWKSGFEFVATSPKFIIDPNIQMAKVLLNDKFSNRFNKTKIVIQAVSKVKIKEENVNSISAILKEQSIKTSNALLNYQLVDTLF